MNKFAVSNYWSGGAAYSMSPGSKGYLMRLYPGYSGPHAWSRALAESGVNGGDTASLRDEAAHRAYYANRNNSIPQATTPSSLLAGMSAARSALDAVPGLANLPGAPSAGGLNMAIKRRGTNMNNTKGASLYKQALTDRLYALIGGLGALSSTGYFLTYLKDRAERRAWEKKLERQMGTAYGRPVDAYIPESAPVVIDALPKAASVLDYLERYLEAKTSTSEAHAKKARDSNSSGSDLLTLVNARSDWSGASKWMDRYLEALPAEIAHRLSIENVDVDKAQDLVDAMGIKASPTLILKMQDQELGRMVGYSPDGVDRFLRRYLDGNDGGLE